MKPSQVDIEFDRRLGSEFDDQIAMLCSELQLEQMNPKAAHQLRGILKHYAKEKHPFTACVRDNTKKFGKDRAERICATIKDQIWGTTKWRGKGDKSGEGPHPYAGMSEGAIIAGAEDVELDADGYVVISDELADFLTQLSDHDLHNLFGLAQPEDSKE